MPRLTSSETIVIFLSLGVLLALARVLGEVARRFNQPAILGELLAGIFLGPSILGFVAPAATAYLFPTTGPVAEVLSGLRTIAIVLFLLVAGMEVDLSTMWRQGRAAISVGISGIVLPFLLGAALSFLAPQLLKTEPPTNKLAFTLFVGTAMSITALPVIARTLMDLRLYRSDLGMVVIAAAVFNDLIGWILFAGILGMIGHEGDHQGGVVRTIFGIVLLTTAVLTVFRWIVHRTLPWIQAHTTWPVSVLSGSIALACLGAACAEWFGIHAIFGAFLVGVAIGDSVHLREHTRNIMSEVVSFFFAPLFFASIGLGIDFIAHFDWLLTLVVVIVACVAKIVGCTMGARLGGMPRRESYAVGFAMNARGAMEIVLGLLALEAGLIGPRLFVSLIVMALVTSMICGPMLRVILGLARTKELRNYLHPKAFVRRLQANDATSAIRELSAAVAAVSGLQPEVVSRAVLERESMMATGIGDGIALPHARLVGLTSPIIGLGLSEAGIDFNAPDGAPAQFVFLIISPPEDQGIQVAVLAQIARSFSDSRVRQALLKVENFTELLAVLKTYGSNSADAP